MWSSCWTNSPPCPLECSVFSPNRCFNVKDAVQKVHTKTPSHCFPVSSIERQALDLKSLAHSVGVVMFTIKLQERRNYRELPSVLSESQTKKESDLNKTLQFSNIVCLFLFSSFYLCRKYSISKEKDLFMLKYCLINSFSFYFRTPHIDAPTGSSMNSYSWKVWYQLNKMYI